VSLKDDLLEGLDGILRIRDDLGVALKVVNIVTRTWSDGEIGAGKAVEESSQILPSPSVSPANANANQPTQYAEDMRINTSGVISNADVSLKYISKNAYPLITDVDCSVTAVNIEKFYELDGILHQVINVREDLLTWTVKVRRLSDQTRY
jgi:hypothetical protein